MDQFAKDRKSYSDPSYKQEASSSNKLSQFFMDQRRWSGFQGIMTQGNTEKH